ncbi:MAG TPA: 2-hydroxyacyl-CoA dehydratase family protein [Syntrophorhabdaceae bacterium]|nr:2-hydroxyacyl-CoA dehydratase family protein [Syntrophorhabdaceae bacterium]HPU29051.1 2-hydroxyacyl-CoA dehydratase family protein [Syntrophorhabdaceae bacterium]
MAGIQNLKGLAKAEKYYTDYGTRAKELRAQGNRVIGYISALSPVEILTASGVVPFRLKGNVEEAITKGDAYMETIVCPFVRNVFDSAIKGKFHFIDGMVLPHQCDSLDRTSDIWRDYLNLSYFHFLNVPHVTDEPSIEFMKEILRLFISTIEDFTGNKITVDSLKKAISLHNENRRLMRSLYDLRKSNPPLITGSEMMKVLVAAMGLPVYESIELIKEIIEDVKGRKPLTDGQRKRIMLIGDQIDSVIITDTIEKAGAYLVMDDISIGSKMYWQDVDEDKEPILALAERYLRKLKIPTTFVDTGGTYEENLNARFGHMRKYIEEFNVEGAILFIYKYCDPYGFEVPAIKSYIEAVAVDVLYLEDEYSISSLARMKTRIEAFLEMIA